MFQKFMEVSRRWVEVCNVQMAAPSHSGRLCNGLYCRVKQFIRGQRVVQQAALRPILEPLVEDFLRVHALDTATLH